MPLSTAGIVTVAIFKFLGLYNNFLGPFIYLSNPKKYTIGVAMYQASQMMQYTADWVTFSRRDDCNGPFHYHVHHVPAMDNGRGDDGSGERMSGPSETGTRDKGVAWGGHGNDG